MAAATRTPFESARRVFVIEAVETMNDQAANRMLKTLEEPPDFVHLLLLTDRREDVLATIASRCQPVRFDPLPPQRIAEGLAGVEPRARAGVRAPGARRRAPGGAPGERAGRGAARERRGLRARGARRRDRASARGSRCSRRPRRPARSAGERAHERARRTSSSCVPAKERKRYEREALEARRRGERRARTQALDLMLRLAELWLRDVLCVCEGAAELVYAVDRRAELEADARRARQRARRARRSSWCGHAPAPDASTSPRSSRSRRSPTGCRRCSRARRPSEPRALGDAARDGRLDLSIDKKIRSVGDRPEVRLEAVGLERQNSREQAVLGAVVVGRAGAQQAELGAARRRAGCVCCSSCVT